VRVENFVADVDPKSIGFDAAVEFAPDWRVLPAPMFRRRRWALLARVLLWLGLLPRVYLDHRVYRYEVLVRRMLAKPRPGFKRFRCLTPGWDNSPRRARNAFIFQDATPRLYEKWLRTLVRDTVAAFQGDERLVFVNAWNEWAEGNHLEPDDFWGRAYLEATLRATRSGDGTGQA
jgi:hypothetical protein